MSKSPKPDAATKTDVAGVEKGKAVKVNPSEGMKPEARVVGQEPAIDTDEALVDALEGPSDAEVARQVRQAGYDGVGRYKRDWRVRLEVWMAEREREAEVGTNRERALIEKSLLREIREVIG
jgi:hypothetical protein